MSLLPRGGPPRWTAKAGEDLRLIAGEAAAEASRAARIHAPMSGQHEAYGVILEEVEEFWDEVRCRQFDWPAARKELIQVAAMCLRAIHDLEKR